MAKLALPMPAVDATAKQGEYRNTLDSLCKWQRSSLEQGDRPHTVQMRPDAVPEFFKRRRRLEKAEDELSLTESAMQSFSSHCEPWGWHWKHVHSHCHGVASHLELVHWSNLCIRWIEQKSWSNVWHLPHAMKRSLNLWIDCSVAGDCTQHFSSRMAALHPSVTCAWAWDPICQNLHNLIIVTAELFMRIGIVERLSLHARMTMDDHGDSWIFFGLGRLCCGICGSIGLWWFRLWWSNIYLSGLWAHDEAIDHLVAWLCARQLYETNSGWNVKTMRLCCVVCMCVCVCVCAKKNLWGESYSFFVSCLCWFIRAIGLFCMYSRLQWWFMCCFEH